MGGFQEANSGSWQKGQSGNAGGRPCGTGKYQREAIVKAHERVANLRFQNALNAVSARETVIDDYLNGSGVFAFLVDDGARLVELDLDSVHNKTTINKKPVPLDMKKVKIKFR